ncbi:9832_t:CDS:2, partial [Paraglomus brasilianum]
DFHPPNELRHQTSHVDCLYLAQPTTNFCFARVAPGYTETSAGDMRNDLRVMWWNKRYSDSWFTPNVNENEDGAVVLHTPHHRIPVFEQSLLKKKCVSIADGGRSSHPNGILTILSDL